MQRIVIHEIEKEGKIEKIVGYCIVFPKGDLREQAKKEFKDYKPGKRKSILIFNDKNEIIYSHKNYL